MYMQVGFGARYGYIYLASLFIRIGPELVQQQIQIIELFPFRFMNGGNINDFITDTAKVFYLRLCEKSLPIAFVFSFFIHRLKFLNYIQGQLQFITLPGMRG